MTFTGTLHADLRDEAVAHLNSRVSVDLQGVPGAGCSMLANAISAELEDAGWQVVRVQGIAALADRPLEALSIAGLVERQGTPQGPTTAVSAAVFGLLKALKGGSTLLVIDDVEDLDEMSAGAIIAAHAQSPFPILTTSHPTPRPVRPSSLVTAAIHPGVIINVPPLDFVDTQTLLVETLGGPIESSAVSRIFAASGGIPSIALAIADTARAHGTLRDVNGMWESSTDLWAPELSRTVEPLLHQLSPEAIDALHALALAGTVDLATARQLMSWEVLEELDGYRLLRFLPRDDDMLVTVFPLAVVEFFRHHALGARHLRVDAALTAAFSGTDASRLAQGVTPSVTPWRASTTTDTPPTGSGHAAATRGPASGTVAHAEDDMVVNRLLVEHWQRELLVRRAEWEASPNPRTAAALLRTMLVTGADAESVLKVREETPRVGDRRELAAFDDWYALYAGVVEHNLDWVRSVLSQAREESDEWVQLIDGIEKFIELLTDHAPDPEELPEIAPGETDDETREVVGVVKAETLLARGRSAEALEELADLPDAVSDFRLTRDAAVPFALMLEGRLDEALQRALDLLNHARLINDVEGIVGAAYVAAQVYLTRGRTAELRALLGSVLSSGVVPALERPQHVALLSIAASLAAQEGRATTARTLAQQALALATGPGPYPLGSPTEALALLDAADLPAGQAAESIADKLWDEGMELLAKGYLISGYVCALLGFVRNPTKERGVKLAQVSAQIPAPRFRYFEQLAAALTDGDPEVLVAAADHLANAGYVWEATEAYTAGLAALRAAGNAARAAEVHEEARTRLEHWGEEAAAGLRSAAEGAELTAREDEIARLAASGLSNQEIARRLLISVRTVENHLHRVFRKLGVENRAEMTRVLTK